MDPEEFSEVKAKKPAVEPVSAKAKASEIPTKRQQATRQPNTEYARDGRLFCKLPQELCDRLDEAVIAERRKRRPKPMDKSIAVEEAIKEWLKKKGY